MSGSLPTIRRIIFHLLLAVFLANAANKFFIVDLQYEIDHGFYEKIFDFVGEAPDQYRIIPLLPLKFLCKVLPFNTAVLIYNSIAGFFCLELFWLLMPDIETLKRMLFSVIFGMSYVFFQYTGWRPATLGLLLICLGITILIPRIKNKALQWLSLGIGILLLSFSRADMALVYAVFFAFYLKDLRLVIFALFPIGAQLIMQVWLFPDAHYYTKPFMLFDNLRGKFMLRNPMTYLLLAVSVGFGPRILRFLREDIRKNLYFYILFVGYLGLVLMVGRLNETRLYLPFIPIFLLLLNGRNQLQRK